MKKTAYIAIFSIIAASVLTAWLLFDYLNDLRSYDASPGRVKSADAIVVLTGGLGRADEGLTLLRGGYAGLLILSGVNEDSDHDAIFLNRLSASERAKIILEKRSRSTYENAVEVRKLVEERGLKSMILITSVYHMKRAEAVFRRVLPPEVRIERYGVSTPNFDENRWWEGKTLSILTGEFVKYYWYEARFFVESAFD